MKLDKTIAFGDIHGCYKAAEAAIALSEKEHATAVFLGDYIDRGPDGIKTLEVLIKAKKSHPNWIFLRGNHDQMLIDLIKGKKTIEDQGNVLEGNRFNYSQSEDSYLKWKKLSKEMQKEVTSFLEDTKFYFETSNWIFLHAVLRDTTESVENKNEEELMWNYSKEPIWEGKPFIHGHALVKEVTTDNRGTNINTECGYGGQLTGLMLSADKVVKVFRISENGEIL